VGIREEDAFLDHLGDEGFQLLLHERLSFRRKCSTVTGARSR
jgi:hypothetical protein